ncbi:ATP phosphoribosyltransferase [Thermoactinomyces mirandus]|uniref:ATP phosphoribosyltransferase n=1 Tax=Thermoactinomyces mirandus TaxID=2756294 RepID=A0A7W1XU22_9BACL|nr:ATP phosphoribosyltransferase [Thermoactinomyces mirandus]MBA4603226.1 ATP phosphoribosyltransferase [Thermoactinomyces mirandus]
MLTIAMPKGRIMNEALSLFQQAGWPVPLQMELDSRKLVVSIPEAGFTLFLAKPMDIPTYVEYGVADLGVAGKDVLMEQARDVYELLDLGISPCRMAVAGKPDWQPDLHPRVATKYPRIAESYFKEQGEQVEIINLHGSVELAPVIGLAERIVDIVSTGQTLRENGLVELGCIAEVTSRLIANKGSYRLKGEAIQELLNQLEQVI